MLPENYNELPEPPSSEQIKNEENDLSENNVKNLLDELFEQTNTSPEIVNSNESLEKSVLKKIENN